MLTCGIGGISLRGLGVARNRLCDKYSIEGVDGAGVEAGEGET